MATIVVGVDGSDGAQAALLHALGEARLRGARLRAVTAWHMSPMALSADRPRSLPLASPKLRAQDA
jgi:nucleotide-binding universal stress UspA family protein